MPLYFVATFASGDIAWTCNSTLILSSGAVAVFVTVPAQAPAAICRSGFGTRSILAAALAAVTDEREPAVGPAAPSRPVGDYRTQLSWRLRVAERAERPR
eukprot:COSAG06_NODE_164_length_21596_cov_37.740500_27_plen_100_part_00